MHSDALSSLCDSRSGTGRYRAARLRQSCYGFLPAYPRLQLLLVTRRSRTARTARCKKNFMKQRRPAEKVRRKESGPGFHRALPRVLRRAFMTRA
ncbi:hypothetical protein AX27061_4114 [Achromobacter xylosoxidans NBRC 15126 = ATCC 27061]|nr:hypothetical protein AX27061_4114 [Achromobacter xylosoxidans NBRC 15126 = ATCC 27061]CCH09787.1 hypothetical protein NH44784_058451 [Achromobacter xylosoxidans NH44784-1996]